MPSLGVASLVIASAQSVAASVAHLACIAMGAPAYRAMGAGSRMVRDVEAGRMQPVLITLAIAGVLLVWSAYALSAAGLIGRLPLLKTALVVISAVLLTRAAAFPWMRPMFPDNSDTFWRLSSGLCGVMGLCFLFGLIAQWKIL